MSEWGIPMDERITEPLQRNESVLAVGGPGIVLAAFDARGMDPRHVAFLAKAGNCLWTPSLDVLTPAQIAMYDHVVSLDQPVEVQTDHAQAAQDLAQSMSERASRPTVIDSAPPARRPDPRAPKG